MTSNSTKSAILQLEAETAVHLRDDWFDPIEAGLRGRVRELIQAMIEGELEAALCRPRYGRQPKADPENARPVPAKANTAEGTTSEWKSTALRAYQRRTKQADSLIAGAYLAGTNTRRVRRALSAVFGGAVSKDTVSRVWRKVKS